MSDFFLDFRHGESSPLKRVAERLRFFEDTASAIVADRRFGMVVTYTGDEALWSPYRGETDVLVAVAGRPVFDEHEWEAERSEGAGGLASRIIHDRYEQHGVSGIQSLNGCCAVIVCDRPRGLVHLVTDCVGGFPAFEHNSSRGVAYCSHPDVLADSVGEAHQLDEISLVEFGLTGTVTPPYSYYRRVRAADHGTIFTFDLKQPAPPQPVKRRHFLIEPRIDPQVSVDQIADELAVALRRAVRRRTARRLGSAAIGLSGGLDSRAIAACVEASPGTFAFCCYDEPNREFKVARTVAESLAIPFVPVLRGCDYYADHAELGVRISGGMGSFANNHFLGAIPRLKAAGMSSLVTGCYCDYLFKGLPLDRHTLWPSGRETLAPYQHRFYFEHYASSTPLAGEARERWESRIPLEFRRRDSVESVFCLEAGRTFPLFYEGDNQQRLIPPRVTGWSPPFIDRDVLDVYRRVPYHAKLNRSLFRKAVSLIDHRLMTIVDANTGARPDASSLQETVSRNVLRVQRRLRGAGRSLWSDGSWPNWKSYVPRSQKLATLWARPNPDAMDFFRRAFGQENVGARSDAYVGDRAFLFVQLLTLKLWLDQHR